MNTFLSWAGFTVLGVWAQRFLPGVDFLAPGIMICLQEGMGSRALQLAVAWLILQEGMGVTPFGFGIVWYASLAVLFYLGEWLFESKNVLFVFFIGSGLGATKLMLINLFGALKDHEPALERQLMESALQAVVFTVEWLVIYAVYRHYHREERELRHERTL